MSDFLYDFLLKLSIASCYFPLIYIFYRWKSNRLNWILLGYFFLACATEFVSLVVIYVFHMYNIFVINLYNVPLIILIALLYHYILKGKLIRFLIAWLTIFSVVFLWYLVNHDILFNCYNWAYIVISIGAIFLSVHLLFRFLIESTVKKLLKDGLFLLNFAIFFYFANTFYLTLFESLMFYNNKLHSFLWPIQLITTIISNCVFTYALVRLKKEERKQNTELPQMDGQ